MTHPMSEIFGASVDSDEYHVGVSNAASNIGGDEKIFAQSFTQNRYVHSWNLHPNNKSTHV